MPRYRFLGKYRKLNIDNFKTLAMDLYNKDKEKIIEKDDKVSNYFNKLESRKAHDRLNYFIDITKKYLSLDNEELLIKNLRLSPIQVRNYAIDTLKEKLIKYGKNDLRKKELLTLLNNKSENKNFSIIDLGKMVKDSLDVNYKNQLNVSLISLIPNDIIIRQYDKFIDFINGCAFNEFVNLDSFFRIKIDVLRRNT